MSEQNLQTYLTELTNEHVAVTPEAQTMLAQLLDDADDEYTAIRVFVQGGGCGGMGGLPAGYMPQGQKK